MYTALIHMPSLVEPKQEQFSTFDEWLVAFDFWKDQWTDYNYQYNYFMNMMNDLVEENKKLSNTDLLQKKRNLELIEKISSLLDESRKEKLTTKIPTTPKRTTKTVLVTFRVEEELKERFTAYCAERNVSISTVLRDFMEWEMRHPFGEPD